MKSRKRSGRAHNAQIFATALRALKAQLLPTVHRNVINDSILNRMENFLMKLS